MRSKFESTTKNVKLPFPEYNILPDNPVPLGQKWLQEAIFNEVREPRAMTLASANCSGLMSSRTMAILEFHNTGIYFATHSCSRKIKDINEVPFACGHFYWRELGRQLSVSGTVKQASRKRAVQEWNNRPIPLHSMSTVSYQSEPLEFYEQLLSESQQLENMGALSCPERFKVYVIEPLALEFWASCSNRLHKRLRFELTQNEWKCLRLQP
jgi:pyridoxamine 5'-phosphate oxidase